MEGRRDVAGGERRRAPRCAGRASVTTPLSTSSPAAAASSTFGRRADPDDDEVGGEPGVPVGGHRRHPAAGAAELADDGVGEQVDAVVAVQPGEDAAHLRAEHGVQRGRLRLDDRHLVAVVAGRRGDLEADPAGADDHHPPSAAGEVGQQPVGVGEGAQVADAVQVGARHRAAAGPTSRWPAAAWRRSAPRRSSSVSRCAAGVQVRWPGRRCAARRRARRTSPAGCTRGLSRSALPSR